MTRLEFIFSEIVIGLRRNILMTLSLVLVTGVSLFLVGGGILTQRQVEAMKDYWYNRVQVSIFLCPDAESSNCDGPVTDAQRKQLGADLASAQLKPYVKEVFYESKQKAYERFREQFKDNALSDTITPELMPESYRVQLWNPEQYKTVADLFQNRPGVDSVETQNKVLDALFTALNRFKWGAWILALITLICSAMNVAVTVRLTAFTRRRETGIMRLVGASNLVIQLPFILENVIAAVAGAVLASGFLLFFMQFAVTRWLRQGASFVGYLHIGDTLAVFPWLFLIAILLAGVSSYLSLLRYLRV